MLDGHSPDRQSRLDRQRGGQVPHEPDINPVRGEPGIDEGTAVEFDEVDLVRSAGQHARCPQQGFQILLLVA